MNQRIAEAIGLLRHRIISPVLMENKRSQISYFKSLENKEFEVPGIGLKKFKASTMKAWLIKYKKFGFSGISPKIRFDKGTYRRLTSMNELKIIALRKDNPSLHVTGFYEICLSSGFLGSPPVCVSTLRKFLKDKELFTKKEPKARKRYEMDRFSQLWVGDFMHGPLVLDGKKRRKAILFAIIDDFSRLIVGGRFSFFENTKSVEDVFKKSIMTFGLPERLYLDNGPAFSSKYLSLVCAKLGIGLVHSKPYDSPSRGKIERFFRTVRENFLLNFLTSIKDQKNLTIEKLNTDFSIWLRDKYHHKIHSGIKTRPIDRYNSSIIEYIPKRTDSDLLDELFMVVIHRNVIKDSTLTYKGIIFEAPSYYIGQRIELRHVQDDLSNVYIYENNKRISKIKPVDTRENGRIYRPLKENHISLTQNNLTKEN